MEDIAGPDCLRLMPDASRYCNTMQQNGHHEQLAPPIGVLVCVDHIHLSSFLLLSSARIIPTGRPDFLLGPRRLSESSITTSRSGPNGCTIHTIFFTHALRLGPKKKRADDAAMVDGRFRYHQTICFGVIGYVIQ